MNRVETQHEKRNLSLEFILIVTERKTVISDDPNPNEIEGSRAEGTELLMKRINFYYFQ